MVGKSKSYIKCFVDDLMDNYDQSRLAPNRPRDKVSGYSLRQIYDALITDGVKEFKDNLKARYSNPTEQYLDDYYTSLGI